MKTPAERVAAAKKAAITRRERGEKAFGGHKLTHEERVRAAATRKARGENPLAHLSAAQRSERAKKAAAKRKLEGLKPFGHMTHEQRVAAAKKAAATRLARGSNAWS